MRCVEIREMLDQENSNPTSARVRQHLEVCSECRSYAADLSVLREGVRLLAQEPVPEPSVYFHIRVLRRLSEDLRIDFLENAGRRVVYATLLVVVILLLAMVLPSSGPVRRSPNLQNYWPQAESVAAGNYQIPMESLSPEPVLVDVKSSASGGR
jgi:hypothetical protein